MSARLRCSQAQSRFIAAGPLVGAAATLLSRGLASSGRARRLRRSRRTDSIRWTGSVGGSDGGLARRPAAGSIEPASAGTVERSRLLRRPRRPAPVLPPPALGSAGGLGRRSSPPAPRPGLVRWRRSPGASSARRRRVGRGLARAGRAAGSFGPRRRGDCVGGSAPRSRLAPLHPGLGRWRLRRLVGTCSARAGSARGARRPATAPRRGRRGSCRRRCRRLRRRRDRGSAGGARPSGRLQAIDPNSAAPSRADLAQDRLRADHPGVATGLALDRHGQAVRRGQGGVERGPEGVGLRAEGRAERDSLAGLARVGPADRPGVAVDDQRRLRSARRTRRRGPP